MSQSSFNGEIVRQCLRQLGARFRTKELSRHPLMLDRHQDLVTRRNYHGMVGAYLSSGCPDVEPIGGPSHADGALWNNRLHAEAPGESLPESAAVRSAGAAAATDAGPQNASDSSFTARMRLHQSWFRAAVLQLPFGSGPLASSTRELGNMLRTEDAQRGSNFLTPEIHQVARERLREGGRSVEPFRLLHNMLSSQPMCFNLFGPLVKDAGLATRLFQALPELEVDRVVAVKLEYAPEPASEYLADGTSFDAFVEYVHRNGNRAFVGVETKLTDGFSQKVCDAPAYRRWMGGPRAPWRPDATARVSDVAHNQLWRDHLLAIAMRDHGGKRFEHGTLMLVRHPMDHGCEPLVRGYRQLLVDGDTSFVDMPMDRLVERWRAALGADERGAWLSTFAQRYLTLGASEGFR